jgi:sugar-specific transcriptional regulator TrmB
MANYTPLLRSLGLNESEADIYLTGLEIGPSSAQTLVKRTGYSRPAAYDAIDALLEKGLLSSQKRGKRFLYAAEPPERLVAFAESQAKVFESRVKQAASAVEDLKMLQHGERPTVKFFEGIEGLKAILLDVVSSKPETTLEIANLDAVNTFLSVTERKAVQSILVKNKSKGRALLLGEVARVRPGVEARVLPKGTFDFYGDLLVYGDKISMVTFKDRIVGAVVENGILADTWRVLFDLAWKGASSFPKVS